MTHYDEFGLPPTASLAEIQQAHRSLAKLLHPDRIQDPEQRRLAEGQFKRLNGIYMVLADPVRRLEYNRRVMRWPPAPQPRPRLALSGGRSTWTAPVLAAVLSLAAGFQLATWWQQPDPALGGPGAQTSAVSSPGGPGAGASETARPIQPRVPEASPEPNLANTKELKRMLNQVISERDQAIARLNNFGAAALPAPAGAFSASKPSPSVIPGDTQRVVAGASVTGLQVAASTPAAAAAVRNELNGTWIYSPGPRQGTSPNDQYAAEYIELQITDREGQLWGRYRARYKVPDRAISPEVQFFFEGASTGDRLFSWRGAAGASGEVQLRLASENTMSVNWFTSQLGRNLMLGSGAATLVRVQKN